ncbi:hypothetical protein [Kitasatospora sp. NPDC094016]|uniref:hypothetical protein n=1 Tax=unclassified Kitasatospora TaxID=2633591 RepID=UPI00331C0551
MGETTIKVTVEGLETFVKDLNTFEQDVNGQKTSWTEVPALKPGRESFPATKALKTNFEAFSKSVGESIEAIRGDVDKIVLDLIKAREKLHLGDGEALSEAQMMDVLKDVLGGVTGPPTPPK